MNHMFFWVIVVAACWVLYDNLRDREKRRWIEKNLFAGWKNNQ